MVVVRPKRDRPAFTPDLFEASAPRSAPPVPPPEPTEESDPPPLPATESFFDQPFREFEHRGGGVHLADSVLWFDADRKRELSFISSAHSDFIGKNRRILATDQTVKILTKGTGRIDALTSPYRRSFMLGPLQLEMHPAGRMLGSAQLLVQRDGRRILYTNDFITQRLSTCERARPIDCDVLALPATYGRPAYRFPPREEAIEQIVDFVERTFDDKSTPVLLAPKLGTAQELIYLLSKRGLRIRAHRSIHDVAKVYATLGVDVLAARRLQGQPARDEIVVVPPILRHDMQVRRIKRFRTALISGRAVEPDHVLHMRVDEAFALGEAADYRELVDYVRATGAREVYVTSGYAEELSDELRRTGLRLYPVVPPEQLPLFGR